jgi:hypothetical protein
MISTRRATLLLTLFAFVILPGCVTYWPQTPPAPGTATTIPGRVRVTRTDASSVMLVGVRVQGDTLRGTSADARQQEVAIALRDVKRVEVRKQNTGATVALVLVSAAVAFAAFFTYAWFTTTT